MTRDDGPLQAVIRAAARVVAEGMEANPMAKLSHDALYELRAAVRATDIPTDTGPVEERSWYSSGHVIVRREDCPPSLWEQLPYRRTIGPWESRSA